MATTKDYYQTLGVGRSATQKEIQSAFRKLALKYHPDKNPGDPTAEARFKEITEANDVLSDPEKRKKYDQFGPMWQQAAAGAGAGAGGPGGPFQYQTVDIDPEELRNMFRGFGGDAGGDAGGGSFADLFGSMFGRGRGRRESAPLEVEHELGITLHEAFTGTHRRLTLPDGRTVEVKVPAGVSDGTTLRVPGVRAKIRVTPSREFTREGSDIRVTVPVPLDVALLGGEVEVPTLKGTRVTLTVPPETQNGRRLRLRRLGMPNAKGGAPGDLYAEVKVQLPLPLTDRVRHLAEELRSE
jgi:DnaJ-class molecular chaperone